jgi:hypothetical protein
MSKFVGLSKGVKFIVQKVAGKKSPTITKTKPKVGSLTERRADQDDVIRNADKAIKKRNLTKEQSIAVKKTIAPGMKEISKTRDKIDELKKLREKKMGGGMMGRRMGYSQGKLAVTPREKQLASQYGDKKRITRGDVITAAKSKLGKQPRKSGLRKEIESIKPKPTREQLTPRRKQPSEEPMRDRMKQPLKKKST